jgi:hypothetical protein
MTRISIALLLLALSGCSAVAPATQAASACDGGAEHSWGCQVERYARVNAY